MNYNTDINTGLSYEQVKLRQKKRLVNYNSDVPTKTIGQIICGNIFTLFNLLNFSLGTLIFIVRSYKNLLFLGVVFCNTFISIIQEIRAKKEIDKLTKKKTTLDPDNDFKEYTVELLKKLDYEEDNGDIIFKNNLIKLLWK